MDLTPLKKRQGEQVAKLASTAEQLGSSVLASTTIAVAKALLRALARDEGGGALGEPSADLRRLRTDPGLAAALERDLRVASNQAAILMIDAMALGYRSEIEGQAASYHGVTATVTIGAAERELLAGFPVAGHTPREIVARLLATLGYEIDGALAAPLSGAADPAALPSALGALGATHGARLGAAVEEAYWAATAAGMKALGAALVGQ